MSSSESPVVPTCAACKKTHEPGNPPLKRCAKCKEAHYCSRDCQKADWKNHKKTCGKETSNESSTALPAPSPFSNKSQMESLLGISSTSILRDRPEAEVYTLLVDSYRMRVEDEYMYQGDVDDDSIYGGGNPVIGFRRFLQQAEKRTGVLPSWWNKEKRDACIAKGNAKDHWSTFHCAVEKSDINEHYNSPMAAMQLRMLAEEIIGSNVMQM